MPTTRTRNVTPEAPYPAFAACLERHAQSESGAELVLEQLQSAGDPFVALIAGLILRDEQHHHRLLQELATEVRPLSYLIQRATDADVLVPEPTAKRLKEQVDGLLRGEREGIRVMRRLAQGYLKPGDASAHAVLEWMVRDSEKHVTMLTMLGTHLRRMVERAHEERLHGRRRVATENSFA